MATGIVKCPHCGSRLAMLPEAIGRKCRCPKCKNTFVASDESASSSAPSQPSAASPIRSSSPPPTAPRTEPAKAPPLPPLPPSTASPMPPRPEPPKAPPPVPKTARAPAPPAQESATADLPEFMKANRRIAGRTCPRCHVKLELGDDVFNCRVCGSSMHAACHDAVKGCASPTCSTSVAAPPSSTGLSLAEEFPVEAPAAPPAPPPASDERPCRFCGERIKINARKCRFCNEFQSEVDRPKASRAGGSSNPDDDTLSGGEILLGILCSGIACIVAIVYLVQGKKKGWKLLLLSIIVQVILGIIQVAVNAD